MIICFKFSSTFNMFRNEISCKPHSNQKHFEIFTLDQFNWPPTFKWILIAKFQEIRKIVEFSFI